ncbi:ABC transporter permease [Hymenobacter guriensis]|uniref:ABC transporter permease n=1 Tax=Hymenobacter guriensis TaxID=2793065 RepID=A0ABS0KY82_9BACT|nr:ABC transporter permease [Hymenobacter guriensis]MBG8552771.1 ABC transporter permease [Hymenobacter guriensis]
MRGRVLYRLLRPLLLGWLLLSVVFLLSRLAGFGSTVDLTPETDILSSRQFERQQAQQALQKRLGLNLPLFYLSVVPHPSYGPWLLAVRWHGRHNQYHQWLRQLAAGSLGSSYRDGQPVTSIISEALPNTLRLTLPAAASSVGLTLWLGLRLARRRWWRTWVLSLCVALDAAPLFLVATALLLLLANPDAFPLFPAYGLPESAGTESLWESGTRHLYYYALPIGSLLLVTVPGLVLQLVAALEQEAGSQYVVTARAKGLSDRQVLRGHVLRNAALPFITLLTDLLPALLAGAVVVEVIFALPGMGRLLAEAAAARDYPVLLGGVALVAAARLISYWLADALYAWADPRLRRQTTLPTHA